MPAVDPHAYQFTETVNSGTDGSGPASFTYVNGDWFASLTGVMESAEQIPSDQLLQPGSENDLVSIGTVSMTTSAYRGEDIKYVFPIENPSGLPWFTGTVQELDACGDVISTHTVTVTPDELTALEGLAPSGTAADVYAAYTSVAPGSAFPVSSGMSSLRWVGTIHPATGSGQDVGKVWGPILYGTFDTGKTTDGVVGGEPSVTGSVDGVPLVDAVSLAEAVVEGSDAGDGPSEFVPMTAQHVAGPVGVDVPDACTTPSPTPTPTPVPVPHGYQFTSTVDTGSDGTGNGSLTYVNGDSFTAQMAVMESSVQVQPSQMSGAGYDGDLIPIGTVSMTTGVFRGEHVKVVVPVANLSQYAWFTGTVEELDSCGDVIASHTVQVTPGQVAGLAGVSYTGSGESVFDAVTGVDPDGAFTVSPGMAALRWVGVVHPAVTQWSDLANIWTPEFFGTFDTDMTADGVVGGEPTVTGTVDGVQLDDLVSVGEAASNTTAGEFTPYVGQEVAGPVGADLPTACPTPTASPTPSATPSATSSPSPVSTVSTPTVVTSLFPAVQVTPTPTVTTGSGVEAVSVTHSVHAGVPAQQAHRVPLTAWVGGGVLFTSAGVLMLAVSRRRRHS